MKIMLRNATRNDIKMTYEWRNDPRIRRWMFASKQIPWDVHKKFWSARLKRKNAYSYIMQADGKDCGVIRFDQNTMMRGYYEIDIYLAPAFQGKGIGTKILGEVKKIARKKRMKGLTAIVKPDNKRSQKIFEKNGFKLRYQYVYRL